MTSASTWKRGETLALVGESGCGKSISALSIMKLVPDPPGKIVSGEVLFNGEDLGGFNEQQMQKVRGKEIAMIFQEPMTSLNPVLTIGRQLTEALELHLGMSGSEANGRAVELLDMVGIPDGAQRLKSYPHQFSGGMRQRVMIAMALSCNPQLLIADEPTTALDVTIQAQILELIQRLCTELGTAVVLITPQPGGGGAVCAAGQRHVRGEDHRAGAGPGDLLRTGAPVHAGAAAVGPAPRRDAARPAGGRRGAARRTWTCSRRGAPSTPGARSTWSGAWRRSHPWKPSPRATLAACWASETVHQVAKEARKQR